MLVENACNTLPCFATGLSPFDRFWVIPDSRMFSNLFVSVLGQLFGNA
jgi:hypothetical protein